MNPQNPNLMEITTKQQANNGTRQFFDQHHKVSYISYTSGYVRREIKVMYTCPHHNHSNKLKYQFPLNKRKAFDVEYQDYNGETKSYKAFKSVLETCPQKRMDIIDRISCKYKGYKGGLSRMNCIRIAK